MRPVTIIGLLWLVWVVTWIAAAVWADPAQKRATIGAEVRYRIFWLAGTVLLFVPAHGYEGRLRLWTPTLAEAWVCIALIAIGLIFSWWARIHLGTLWSGRVTRKDDHRIVDTGPYGIVRHPIYTGVIVATVATAGIHGTAAAWLGAAVMTAGWYIKARLEETFLREELGAEAYDAYARRVPMLVPRL